MCVLPGIWLRRQTGIRQNGPLPGTVLSCPLGHKCQEVKEGAIHQCAWFVKLAGRNPVTGEEKDEQGCGMSWLPVLLIENAMTNRGTSAAVESLRNEIVQPRLAMLPVAHDPMLIGEGMCSTI